MSEGFNNGGQVPAYGNEKSAAQVMIDSPARCPECSITYSAPTTGTLLNRCDRCGGELVVVVRKPVDLAEAKKICACIPFADARAGLVETEECMRSLILEVESLTSQLAAARGIVEVWAEVERLRAAGCYVEVQSELHDGPPKAYATYRVRIGDTTKKGVLPDFLWDTLSAIGKREASALSARGGGQKG